MHDAPNGPRKRTNTIPPALPAAAPLDVASLRGFVFGEERPFSQCHASTLVELDEGTFVVAFFAGTRERHPDVGIWTAHGVGAHEDRSTPATFEAPRLAAKVADVAHWNPVLYRIEHERTGELALQFKVGRSFRSWRTWLARSRDGGRSFGSAAELVPGDRLARGAVRNKPIRLASGDYLAGSSTESWWRWDAFFDRSPNGIDGWVATAKVEVDRARFAGKGMIQPTLWESRPGVVHALFRTTDRRIYRSDSQDDGRSWSKAYPLDLPHNNSGIDLARLADGTLVLACNPVAGGRDARTPLSLLFSRDEGASWGARIDVETGPGEFSYPAVIASGDGLALCYTWNRRRIAFLRIPSVDPIFAATAHSPI